MHRNYDDLDLVLDQRDAALEEIARLRALLTYAYEAPLALMCPDPDLPEHANFQSWRSEVGAKLSDTPQQAFQRAFESMKREDQKHLIK